MYPRVRPVRLQDFVSQQFHHVGKALGYSSLVPQPLARLLPAYLRASRYEGLRYMTLDEKYFAIYLKASYLDTH